MPTEQGALFRSCISDTTVDCIKHSEKKKKNRKLNNRKTIDKNYSRKLNLEQGNRRKLAYPEERHTHARKRSIQNTELGPGKKIHTDMVVQL